MARLTNDRRFVFDLYRRLIQMFGSVVMGVPDEAFEVVITSRRKLAGVTSDSELKAADWEVVTRRFKEIYRTFTRSDFPTDPFDQLRLATEAVFKSWNGRRAIDYRNAAGIAHDLGTAVNIQTMVYGLSLIHIWREGKPAGGLDQGDAVGLGLGPQGFQRLGRIGVKGLAMGAAEIGNFDHLDPVSYTHLDVYKRQHLRR